MSYNDVLGEYVKNFIYGRKKGIEQKRLDKEYYEKKEILHHGVIGKRESKKQSAQRAIDIDKTKQIEKEERERKILNETEGGIEMTYLPDGGILYKFKFIDVNRDITNIKYKISRYITDDNRVISSSGLIINKKTLTFESTDNLENLFRYDKNKEIKSFFDRYFIIIDDIKITFHLHNFNNNLTFSIKITHLEDWRQITFLADHIYTTKFDIYPVINCSYSQFVDLVNNKRDRAPSLYLGQFCISNKDNPRFNDLFKQFVNDDINGYVLITDNKVIDINTTQLYEAGLLIDDNRKCETTKKFTVPAEPDIYTLEYLKFKTIDKVRIIEDPDISRGFNYFNTFNFIGHGKKSFVVYFVIMILIIIIIIIIIYIVTTNTYNHFIGSR